MDNFEKTYGLNDMVKANCSDCKGCSDCCHNMGDSITLDPFDIYNLTLATGKEFEELMVDYIALGVKGNVVLPHIKMKWETNACGFLVNERCSIHKNRPSICRLFPLGRFFEDGKIYYFLQDEQCSNKNRSKIKVKKWIAVENQKDYDEFQIRWHRFLEKCSDENKNLDDSDIRTKSMELLALFFMKPYKEGFFEDFNKRMLLIES